MASESERVSAGTPGAPQPQPHQARFPTGWHGLPTWLRQGIAGAAIVVVTLVVFSPAIRGGFLWDDDALLTDNKLIRAPDGLYRIWFTTEPYDYFPLSWSALWLLWRVWGMNPAGYHVVSILLHALSAVLMWGVLSRLKIPGAYVAALVFAIHPVAVASVAWISEIKNTLSMPLYLGAILMFLAFQDTRHWAKYALSLGLFLLALLAKTSVVILPLVLLLCAWWRKGKVGARDLAATAPFFVLSAVLGAATVWFQNHRSMRLEAIAIPGGWLSRAATAAWAVWFYLYKDLVPTGLTVIYRRWSFQPASILSYLPLAGLAGALVVLWVFRRRWGRAGLFAMAYFIVALLPVLGFLDTTFSRFSQVADHWQYLAMIAPISLVVGAAWKIGSGRVSGGRATAFGVAVLAVLSWLTVHQVGIYRTRESLFRDNLEKNKECWIAHDEVGASLAWSGNIEAALPHFQEALRLKEDFANAHYNCGVVLSMLGHQTEGLEHLKEAARLNPRAAKYWRGLGLAYGNQRDYDNAIRCLSRAIQLRSDYVDAHYNLGVAFAMQARLEEAAGEFSEALRLDPTCRDAALGLERIRLQQAQTHPSSRP